MRQPVATEQGNSPSIWSRLSTITDYFAWPLRTSHYLELVNRYGPPTRCRPGW